MKRDFAFPIALPFIVAGVLVLQGRIDIETALWSVVGMLVGGACLSLLFTCALNIRPLKFVRRPDYFVMDDDPQPETNYRKWVRDNPDLVDKYVREKLQPK